MNISLCTGAKPSVDLAVAAAGRFSFVSRLISLQPLFCPLLRPLRPLSSLPILPFQLARFRDSRRDSKPSCCLAAVSGAFAWICISTSEYASLTTRPHPPAYF